MFGKDKDNDRVCCVSYINIMSNAGTLSGFTCNTVLSVNEYTPFEK